MDPIQKIQIEIQNIDEEKSFIELYAKKIENKELDEIEIRGLALTTTAIYNGIEKILRFVLESKQILIAKDDSWHLNLLKSSKDNQIISDKIFDELKSFLSFRHFVRHAYAFELKKDSIESIIKKIPSLTNQFLEEIENIIGK